MDDEDLGIACGGTRDVQEMNVVLSKCHNRLVRCIIRCFLDVGPGETTGVGRLKVAHVKEKQLALGESIENIRVVVENGIVGGYIEGAGVYGLGSP